MVFKATNELEENKARQISSQTRKAEVSSSSRARQVACFLSKAVEPSEKTRALLDTFPRQNIKGKADWTRTREGEKEGPIRQCPEDEDIKDT